MKKPDVLAFLASRYPLIPLRGKVPIPKGWTSTALGQFPITELEKVNYGVVLSSRDLVVDVDPRNFAPGDKPLARLVSDCGGAAAFKTFTVRTGGGGLHLYFRVPHDVTVVNGLDTYRGVEFKGAGRQVVGPGSVHPDSGKEYIVAVTGDIAPIPPKLLALIATKTIREEHKNEKGKIEEKFNDSEAAQARYISYLENVAPLSIEGQGGDNTAFKVAAAGRDIGLSAHITETLLDAHWNPRCSPPWEADALADKVRHAYRYGKRDVGSADASRDFSPMRSEAAGPGAPGRAAGAAARSSAGGSAATGAAADGAVAGAESGGKASGAVEADITWELDKDGKVKRTFHNLMNYLKLPNGGLYRVFGYNEFTGQVEFLNPAPWHHGKLPAGGTGGSGGMIQDHDIALLKGYLVARFGFEMNTGPLVEAVTNIAHAPGVKFHPVREYLDSLKGKWDGVARVDKWLSTYVGAPDSAYTRAVGRKVLCAAIRRIYKPGTKFDHILVLEGPQNAGKSQLVKALAGKWSADFSIDPSNKDTVDAMQGKWIVEMAEMSVLNRAEMAALKAFITRDTDRVRQAYGRLTREFPRQCIFIGTINPEADGAYLTDATGNRRFWPVETGERIDFAGVRRDRNQLFAEALELAEKENIFMDDLGLENEAKLVVAGRHAEDPWTERIDAWLHDPVPGLGSGSGREFVTAREIYIDALGGIDKQITRRDAVRIANVMRAAGWVAHVKWRDGRPVRGYVVAGAAAKKAVAPKSPAPAAAEPKSPAPAAAADALDGLI